MLTYAHRGIGVVNEALCGVQLFLRQVVGLSVEGSREGEFLEEGAAGADAQRLVVVAHVLVAQRSIVGLNELIGQARIEALERQVHVGIARKAHQGGVTHVEHLVKRGLGGHLLRSGIGAEDAGCRIGGEVHPFEGGHASLETQHYVIVRRHLGKPPLVEGVQAVEGIEQIHVNVVLSCAIAGLHAPAHAPVLRRTGKRVGGVVVDGLAQASVERTSAPPLLVIILKSYSRERHVHHIAAHCHRVLTEITGPVLIGGMQREGKEGVVELEVVIHIVEREGHGKAIDVDVQVGIDGAVQR